MGALIASPEAGDASVNVIPQMKKYSATSADHSKSFVSTMSEKDTINESSLTSALISDCSNTMNKDAYKQVELMENGILDTTSTSISEDNCQFPYYRSSKSNGQFPDAVLVKDVGISCMLLNQNVPEISTPGRKNYLVKQLKREYNDLSNITHKITAYTKDILKHLSKKSHKKSQLLQNLVSSKHAIASQYIDNDGNLCLKLRLFSNVETQCNSQQIIKDSYSMHPEEMHVTRKLYSKHSKSGIVYEDHMTREESTQLKNEKEVQTVFSKETVEMNTSNSPSYSTSSIYNYLTMRNRKSNEILKSTFTKFNDTDKQQRCYKNCCHNKDRNEHLKRCNPVIFTSWREISRSKRSKNKTSVISDEARETVHTNTREQILQKQFCTYNTISNVPRTKFHTVNIRIVKHNRKHE